MSVVVPDNPSQAPQVRQYLLTSLAAMLILTLSLFAKGFGEWALLPLLLGVLSAVFHWRAGAALLTLVLALVFLLLGPVGLDYFYASDLREVDSFLDPLLVAAVLLFSISHSRMLGLTRNLFPIDDRLLTASRRSKPQRVRGKAHLRSPEAVGGNELVGLLLMVPLCTIVGLGGWVWLTDQDAPFSGNWPPQLWQGMLLLWLTAIIGVLTATVLGYLRRLRAPLAENLLYLQDQLWHDTRGEQSLMNRWLTWARLRRQRGEEERSPEARG